MDSLYVAEKSMYTNEGLDSVERWASFILDNNNVNFNGLRPLDSHGRSDVVYDDVLSALSARAFVHLYRMCIERVVNFAVTHQYRETVTIGDEYFYVTNHKKVVPIRLVIKNTAFTNFRKIIVRVYTKDGEWFLTTASDCDGYNITSPEQSTKFDVLCKVNHILSLVKTKGQ